MQLKQKEILLLLCCFTIIFFPIRIGKSDDTTPPIGTVTILGDDVDAPVITAVTTNENLSSPFDQLAYDSSINTIWYSNIKSFDSVLNISITANTGLHDLKSFNTSTEWNDGANVSLPLGINETTIQFNYTISNGETSNVNVSLEVYDYSPYKATYNITSTVDNTVPNDFDVEALFTTVTETCAYINTTVMDSQSGFNGVGITMRGLNDSLMEYYSIQENFTTSGINKFCSLKNGLFRVYAQAYDQVGNLKNATNNGLVYLQVTAEEETETIIGNQFDLLDLVEIIVDEIYFPIILIFIGIVMLVLARRAIKS